MTGVAAYPCIVVQGVGILRYVILRLFISIPTHVPELAAFHPKYFLLGFSGYTLNFHRGEAGERPGAQEWPGYSQ